jgi:uncharacterized membrane protein
MNKAMKHIKETVISGIIFLIPVFVIIMIFQNLHAKLTGFGVHLAKFLGLKAIGSIGAVSIATSLILAALLYGCGLLVKLTMVSKVRNWLDTHVLQFIPGYLNYKVKMEEKLMPKIEERPPVLVKIGNAERPGFLTDQTGSKCVVFIPSAPDINIGEVWVVDEANITKLGTAEKAFKAGIMHSGKGLLD